MTGGSRGGLRLLLGGCAGPRGMFEGCSVATPSTPPSQPLLLVVSAEGELTGKNLEGSGEEEASTFLQGEELAEEEEERQAAEDDGQDHQGLDRLDPLCRRGRRLQSITSLTSAQRSAPTPPPPGLKPSIAAAGSL